MKYFLILSLTMLIQTSGFAQPAYTTSKDDETGAVVFKGPITMADLAKERSFKWLASGEAAYKPDTNAIKYLKKALPNYGILVFMGTWCDDSQNLIPKLAKVLEASRFPMSRYVMYGVDRAKQTGGIENRLYEIKKVPTIIVLKGQTEIGRIVENVKRNIEVDLVQIIEKSSSQ